MNLRDITTLTHHIPGMSNPKNLLSLYEAAMDSPRSGCMVEIGTWCGRSAAVLAMAATETGRVLHCFEPDPPLSYWRQMINTPALSLKEFNDTILPVYQAGGPFLLAQKNLAGYQCVQLHKSEFTLLPLQNELISFAFIDGDHSYSAVAGNILTTKAQCQPGAVIVLDDVFNLRYPGVLGAAIEFLWCDSHAPAIARKLNNKMLTVTYE